MISKELLSEVLKETIREVYKIGSNSNFKQNTLLFKLYGSGELCHINIYELAHKCKEWAKSKGYYLRAAQGINYHDNLQWTCFLNINMDDGAEYIDYWNSTEVEAIFKACQWILDKDSSDYLHYYGN